MRPSAKERWWSRAPALFLPLPARPGLLFFFTRKPFYVTQQRGSDGALFFWTLALEPIASQLGRLEASSLLSPRPVLLSTLSNGKLLLPRGIAGRARCGFGKRSTPPFGDYFGPARERTAQLVADVVLCDLLAISLDIDKDEPLFNERGKGMPEVRKTSGGGESGEGESRNTDERALHWALLRPSIAADSRRLVRAPVWARREEHAQERWSDKVCVMTSKHDGEEMILRVKTPTKFPRGDESGPRRVGSCGRLSGPSCEPEEYIPRPVAEHATTTSPPDGQRHRAGSVSRGTS